MANYRAARALMGKGRNAGEGAAGLSKSSAQKGARKSAVKKGETNEMTLATAGFVSQDMLTDPYFLPLSLGSKRSVTNHRTAPRRDRTDPKSGTEASGRKS